MSHITLAIQKTTGQIVFLNSDGKVSQEAPRDAQVLVDKKNPFDLKATSPSNGAKVIQLDQSHFIPDSRINRMISGPVENFRVKAGLADEVFFQEKPTIALWIQFDGKEYRVHEFLLAGSKLNQKFSMKKFLGLSGNDEETEV